MAIVLAGVFFAGFTPKGYVWNVYDLGHFSYLFFHANIFHLVGNLIILFLFRQRISLLTLPIAVMASYLPSFTSLNTIGFSGVLFTHLGMTWGRVGQLRKMMLVLVPTIVVFGLLPNVNLALHLYCLFIGYFVSYISNTFILWRKLVSWK